MNNYNLTVKLIKHYIKKLLNKYINKLSLHQSLLFIVKQIKFNYRAWRSFKFLKMKPINGVCVFWTWHSITAIDSFPLFKPSWRLGNQSGRGFLFFCSLYLDAKLLYNKCANTLSTYLMIRRKFFINNKESDFLKKKD